MFTLGRMDALQMLESEHDDIQALLAKLERAKGTRARHLLGELADRLDVLEPLEETYLYALLRQDEDARDIVLEGFQEHALVDKLVHELSVLKPEDEAWRPKVKVLKENVEHHITQEESELFPRVRLIWNDDKLHHLYRKMEQLKAQIKKQRELGLLPTEV
jgi:oligoendopeptidase F